MTLDATLRPVAARLINKYGKSITYSRITQGSYDPITGGDPQLQEDTIIKAVIDKYSAMDMANGLIERGDVKLTIADMFLPPTSSDTFVIDGIPHTVVSITPVYTGELIGIYEIQARRT